MGGESLHLCMAKQVGPFFITGTIGGVSFYKSGDQYLVRMAGGPDKKKILHSPNFVNTRRNISEFGNASKDATFLRRMLARHFKLNDAYLYQRQAKLFTQLKNFDTSSVYGERRVSKGLQDKTAKQLLCDFAFSKKGLKEVLICKPVINTDHLISLTFKNLVFAKGANKVVISAVRLLVDFENRNCIASEYTEIIANKNSKQQEIKLKSITAIEAAKGRVFYFLQLRFYTNNQPLDIETRLGCIAIDPQLQKENELLLIAGEIVPYGVLEKIFKERIVVEEEREVLIRGRPG